MTQTMRQLANEAGPEAFAELVRMGHNKKLPSPVRCDALKVVVYYWAGKPKETVEIEHTHFDGRLREDEQAEILAERARIVAESEAHLLPRQV